MYCKRCGTELQNCGLVCPECGYQEESSLPKSKTDMNSVIGQSKKKKRNIWIAIACACFVVIGILCIILFTSKNQQEVSKAAMSNVVDEYLQSNDISNDDNNSNGSTAQSVTGQEREIRIWRMIDFQTSTPAPQHFARKNAFEVYNSTYNKSGFDVVALLTTTTISASYEVGAAVPLNFECYLNGNRKGGNKVNGTVTSKTDDSMTISVKYTLAQSSVVNLQLAYQAIYEEKTTAMPNEQEPAESAQTAAASTKPVQASTEIMILFDNKDDPDLNLIFSKLNNEGFIAKIPAPTAQIQQAELRTISTNKDKPIIIIKSSNIKAIVNEIRDCSEAGIMIFTIDTNIPDEYTDLPVCEIYSNNAVKDATIVVNDGRNIADVILEYVKTYIEGGALCKKTVVQTP